MIRLLFVIQVPDASDKRVMAAFFRPINRFLLRFEGAEFVVRVVFVAGLLGALRRKRSPCFSLP